MIKRTILGIIKGYQWVLSPDHRFWGRADRLHGCRFYPSCSEYAHQAIEKYGVSKGMWVGLKRILRCHPWNPGGVDNL